MVRQLFTLAGPVLAQRLTILAHLHAFFRISLYALEREWSGFLGRPFLLAEEEYVPLAV